MILTALVLPILIMFAGMAIDFGIMQRTRTCVQAAADAAAMAAAQNLFNYNHGAAWMSDNDIANMGRSVGLYNLKLRNITGQIYVDLYPNSTVTSTNYRVEARASGASAKLAFLPAVANSIQKAITLADDPAVVQADYSYPNPYATSSPSPTSELIYRTT